MTADEQRDILRRIGLLREMTTTRGCTPAEADVAALKIGQAVQHYPLILSFTPSPPPKQERAKSSLFDWVGDEVRVVSMTEKAMCFATDSEQYGEAIFWVPRSQLRGECVHWGRGDHGPLHVTKWWADKEGWSEE